MKSLINFPKPKSNNLLLIYLIIFMYSINVSAQMKYLKTKDHTVSISAAADSHKAVRLNANRMDYWVSNNGHIFRDELNDQFGMSWADPYGSLMYAGGFYIGGKKPFLAGDTISVSEVEYHTEYRAGRILNFGPIDSLITEDSSSGNARVFVLPEHHAIWPPEAPHDSLGNPMKLSVTDTWAVFNDLSAGNVPAPFSPAPKLGIEIQRQTFQFSEYPFDYSVLVRMQIINKSNLVYDSCYFGIWADPDIGSEFNEDLCTVDTSLSLLSVYSDPSGADSKNSAAGILILQTPTALSAGTDSVYITGINESGFYQHLRTGRRATGFSGAVSYQSGFDPNGINGKVDLSRNWYMSGFDLTGNPKLGGPFDLLSGDSVPGDYRIVIGMGPFIFAGGDTQEVWLSFIGSKSTSKTGAVDSLRNYARLIRDRFGSNMNEIVVSIHDEPVHQRSSIAMLNNYPNPFNPATVIHYHLNLNSHVSLKIYNILGQEVCTLINGYEAAGYKQVMWDGKDDSGRAVCSGIYVSRLKAGKNVKTQKMMLIR